MAFQHPKGEAAKKNTKITSTEASYTDEFTPLTAPMLKKVPETNRDSTMGYHSIDLHTGVLYFTNKDVPEPPTGIGLDIEALASIWDDSWPSWKHVSPLVIKGKPIPLKFFHSIYIRSSQWKFLKQNWSKWNVSWFLFDKLQLY